MSNLGGAARDARKDRPLDGEPHRASPSSVGSDARFRLTFEDLWATPPDLDRALIASLPRLDAGPPGGPQIVVPDTAEPPSLSVAPGRTARPGPAVVRLDDLAAMPWVTSVVAQVPIEVTRPLPHVTELFAPGMFGQEPDERTLANLPGLVRIVIANVRPDLLSGHAALRDAYIGWRPPVTEGPVPWASDGLAALARLRGLERLRVRWCPPESVAPLIELGSLRWLAIEGLRDHRRLGALAGLERLEVRGVSIASFQPWSGLTGLRRLAAYGRVGGLTGIEGMGALEDLAITTPRVPGLGPMGGLTALRRLWLWTRALPDVAPLAALATLEELVLHTAETPDLGPLAGRLPQLRRLEIHLVAERARPLRSLGFVEGLQALEEVVLGGVLGADASLDDLAGLPCLRRLEISGRAAPDLTTFRRRRPDVVVEAWSVPEPAGRVHVGPVHYDPPRAGVRDWFILQSLAEELGTETNYGAERLVRAALRERDADLARRLRWDTEGGAVGVGAHSEADIRAVAEVVAALIVDRGNRPT